MSFNFTNDLNCYSLSKSDNVPTSVFDMNHYYTYRQNKGNNTPGISLPHAENSVKTEDVVQHPLHDPPQPSRLSKIDLLIQTATSAHLDDLLSQRSSSFSSDNNPPLKKQKLDMNHLCSQAEKLEKMDTANSNYSSWMHKKALESKKQQDTIDNNNINITTSQGSSSQQDHESSSISSPLKPVKRKGSIGSSPTAIKLASPSNNTKRQRSGPSCDCCRSRKIKCDSEIFIMSDLSNEEIVNSSKDQQPSEVNSFIAHCEFVSFNESTGYQYYKIFKDGDHSLNNNNKLNSFSYLQFKPCSACTSKNLKCCFSKGFTRNDIIRFNKHERKSLKSTSSATTTTTTATVSDTAPSSINGVSSTSSPNSSSPNSASTSTTSLVNQDEPQVKLEGAEFDNTLDLPTPSPTPSNQTNLQDQMITPPQSERKSNKKTSCKTCRSKKIKCVKTEGSNVCVHCIKKSQGCDFE